LHIIEENILSSGRLPRCARNDGVLDEIGICYYIPALLEDAPIGRAYKAPSSLLLNLKLE